MNKIESKIFSAILFGFILILTVLATVFYPSHKIARLKFSGNIEPASRFILLFPCPLKVRDFVLAMNVIAFYRSSGWKESWAFLRNRNRDFWLDRIQR